MKRLRDTIILLIALGMMLPMININEVKGDPDYDIVIFVEQRLYDNQAIGDAIDTYVADLQYEGWYTLALFCGNVTTMTPEGIRGNLRFFLELVSYNRLPSCWRLSVCKMGETYQWQLACNRLLLYGS